MRSFCPRALHLAVPFCLLATLPAQWRAIPVNAPPPASYSMQMARAPGGDLLLHNGQVFPDCWLWSGTHWSTIPAPLPLRSHPALAYDHGAGETVLFGGVIGGSTVAGIIWSLVPQFDTWRFDGDTWNRQLTANAPPPLQWMSMAHDPQSGDMILVGRNAAGEFETWRLDADWHLVSPSLKPTVWSVQMFIDTVRGQAAAFWQVHGGLEVCTYHNGLWTRVATLTTPIGPGISGYDENTGNAYFYTENPYQFSRNMFEWDGTALSQVQAWFTSPGYSVQEGEFDSRRGEFVRVVPAFPMETWTWSPAPIPFATPYGDPCQHTTRLDLFPGDVPRIGATHRLTAQTSGGLTFAMLGLSHVMDELPLPQPIPGSNCMRRVQNLVTVLLPANPAVLSYSVPNNPAFLGMRYDAQFFVVGSTGVVDATNGLEVQIGV